jgi:hypothetical protein
MCFIGSFLKDGKPDNNGNKKQFPYIAISFKLGQNQAVAYSAPKPEMGAMADAIDKLYELAFDLEVQERHYNIGKTPSNSGNNRTTTTNNQSSNSYNNNPSTPNNNPDGVADNFGSALNQNFGGNTEGFDDDIPF